MNDQFLKLGEMNEDQAREMLESIRWPNGPICPKCGSDKGAWKLESKPETKNKMRPGLYKCKACDVKFTVTMGTIFEDSHIPLKKWLLAIYLMNASKKGISAHQLHRKLDMTYKAAWFMAHRIRFAMTQEPLTTLMTGEVELDATYIGGKERFKHFNKRNSDARGGAGKTPVFALVERGGNLRAKKMAVVGNYEVREIVRKHVLTDATLMTDLAPEYLMLDREYPKRNVVVHQKREYVRGRAHTNTLEGWFSLLKRGVTGTFHHVSEQHLDRYVTEFEFRYNNRKIADKDRAIMAVKQTGGKRLVYKDAVSQTGD